jgi:hypothetical protein
MVSGFWGVTTVVTGVLKQSLKEDIHGISVAIYLLAKLRDYCT